MNQSNLNQSNLNQPNMNLSNPLDLLKDIHLPEPSPWWDIAMGWWILALCIIGLLVWAAPKLWRRWLNYRRNKVLQHDIQAQFKDICDEYAQHQDAAKLLSDSNVLLRRVVLTLYPKTQNVGLTGKDWLFFLDSVWVNKPELSFVSSSIQNLLLDGAYRPVVTANEGDINKLVETIQAWLKSVSHHV
ncbi:MAG: DUF4381 domain-containing protein [Ghiorsea sp.]